MRPTLRICLITLALGGLASAPACDNKEGAKKADAKKADAKKADAKKADAKKADAKKADAKPADAKPADAKPADDKAAPEQKEGLTITARHEPAKPDDPVIVHVPGIKVLAAKFDPANLEGGTAELEIDPTSLVSGSDARDTHLKSPDYLDLPQFPTIKVAVSDIKRTGDGYSAKLVVDAHGKQVTWEAVPFQVTKTEDKTVTVTLEQAFKRSDFGIGKVEGDSVADALTASLLLPLSPT